MKGVTQGYAIILAGILFSVSGICFAIWLGIVTMLIGGVGDFINAVQASHVDGVRVAWDIVKVIFFPFVTGICAIGSIVIGFFMCAFGLSIAE